MAEVRDVALSVSHNDCVDLGLCGFRFKMIGRN